MPQPTDQHHQLVTDVPGPKSQSLRKREDAHLTGGTQGYALMAGIAVDRAVGSAITDVDGNTFLDFIGGIGVGAIGHSHPAWVTAVAAQAASAAVGSLTSAPRVELLERVARHPPARGVHRLQLYSGGSEAVESALRLAKAATGKHEVIGCWGGFHGKTHGALSVMGSSFKHGFGPLVPGTYLVPYADCYRCPIGSSYPSCGLGCVELARKKIKLETTGATAAVIVEPMQGTAGNVIPPPELLPAMRSIADDADALLIVDEMITGLGRTGKWWGAEHSGTNADIVTIGKAIGGGFPLSALATTDSLATTPPWASPSGSSSSYGGNPLAAAAGAAALRIIDEEHLVERSARVGAAMLRQLETWVERYPFVGTVRGAGMLLAIELVSDKQKRTPLSRDVTGQIFHECVRRGLLAMTYASSVRIQPPLTTDLATAENGLAILREVFDLVREHGWWK